MSPMMDCHALANPCHLEQAGIGGGLQRIAGDFGTQALQPQRQPAALEAGWPVRKTRLPRQKCRVHCQTFQGALPLAHSSSS